MEVNILIGSQSLVVKLSCKKSYSFWFWNLSCRPNTEQDFSVACKLGSIYFLQTLILFFKMSIKTCECYSNLAVHRKEKEKLFFQGAAQKIPGQ